MIKTHGFAKAVRVLVHDDYANKSVVPDGWYFVTHRVAGHTRVTICLIEIEDWHPLSIEKLQHLVALWWNLDGDGITLRLFVYDRYGENKREIDLYAYDELLRDYRRQRA